MIRHLAAKLLGPTTRKVRSVVGPPLGRLIHGGNVDASSANPVALQMIDYALSLARSQRSDESHAQGMLVLEQCLSSQSSMDDSTDTLATDNSKGMVLLAMSDLLFARGNYGDAMDKLQSVPRLTGSSLGVRVAAMEALVGLNLELGDDDASSVLANKCLELLEGDGDEVGGASVEVVRARAKAVKGFVELVKGNVESAEPFFKGLKGVEDGAGAAALSYGELLHATRNLSDAKDLYVKVIEGAGKNKDFTKINALGACNMSPDEILLAATCSLGQLEGHLGNFGAAEETLTKALNKAEELFGSRHPKVGVVLTCLGLMFGHKARDEQSSSILIQEGLYRRAIELLKAPPLDSDGDEMANMRDIVAVARGGYAAVLGLQQNRKEEAERMKKWAESVWNTPRFSLDEFVNLSESSSKVPVIDARICRAL